MAQQIQAVVIGHISNMHNYTTSYFEVIENATM